MKDCSSKCMKAMQWGLRAFSPMPLTKVCCPSAYEEQYLLPYPLGGHELEAVLPWNQEIHLYGLQERAGHHLQSQNSSLFLLRITISYGEQMNNHSLSMDSGLGTVLSPPDALSHWILQETPLRWYPHFTDDITSLWESICPTWPSEVGILIQV